MSLPLNIDDLIHQRKVESARIEYKKDWNPEKVLHSVCAFANDIDNWGGGYIILGVEEKNGMPVLPPKGIRKESVDADLKKFTIRSRFYRNRRIGEFLKELDLAEGRNTGIGKIVRAMRENGSPDPQFYNPETRSFMTVILPIHEAFKEVTTEEKSEPVVKTVVESVEKSVEKILRHLSENAFATQNELAVVTGLSVRGVEKNLKILKAAGRLRRIGPDKGGHWEVVK